MTTIGLSISSLYAALDELLSSSRGNEKNNYLCRRAKLDDLSSIHEFITGICSAGKDQNLLGAMPFEALQKDYSDAIEGSTSVDFRGAREAVIPFYIVLEEEGNLRGVALWTFGYSTWKGRVMNLDTLATDETLDGVETSKPLQVMLMTTLISVAKLFDCVRIVYQVEKEKAVSFQKNFNCDLLAEWLTLQMGRDQIQSFVSTRDRWAKGLRIRYPSHKENDRLDPIALKPGKKTQSVNDTFMDQILLKMNTIFDCCRLTNGPDADNTRNEYTRIRFREATASDADSILNLVHGLASYEKASHEVSVRSSIYVRDDPLFECILVEVISGDPNNIVTSSSCSSKVVGMGFYYLGYALSSGKYLYLEDLFIEHEYRGYGCGKALMYCLAEICMKLGCSRFVWQALDWNSPALNFYDSIGAITCNGLKTVRLGQENIDAYEGV